MHRRILSALTCAALTGCSSNATILTRDRVIEAEVLGSSRTQIEFALPHRKFKLRRDDIEDIDHPGNVHAVVGGLLLPYGLLNIYAGHAECDRRGAAVCAGVYLPLLIGAGMLAWGMVVWDRSTRRAALPQDERASDLSYVPPLGPRPLKLGARP
jgi:hypothetical protein